MIVFLCLRSFLTTLNTFGRFSLNLIAFHQISLLCFSDPSDRLSQSAQNLILVFNLEKNMSSVLELDFPRLGDMRVSLRVEKLFFSPSSFRP